MSVTKVRAGRYRLRYYGADGRERQITRHFTSRDAALAEERRLLAERDRGESAVRPEPHEAPALSAFAETWIEESRIGWKASTLDVYRQVLQHQILPTFGALRVNQIDESGGRRWMTALHDDGLGARRINLALLVLKMLLRRAARAKWLEAGDPLGEIKPLAEPDADVDPLAPSEITAFVAAAPAWWRPFFVTAFWTGARPGELAALRWPDVDAHARRFGIRARLYRGELGAPKTKASSRDVDMLPPVVDALRQQRAQQAQQRLRGGVGVPDAEHDFVFTGPDGGTLNLNYLRERIWAPTFRRAGLRARSFYQTRHSFASNALAAGEDPTWIARTLGHKTVELLFSTYTKWVPTRTRRDGSALLAHFQAGQKPGYDTGDLRAVESGGPDRATDSVS